MRLLEAPAEGAPKGRVLTTGVFRDDVLRFVFENRGGSYDFHRRPPGEESDFYPRRRPTTYAYAPPRPRDDGWRVARVEEVGISREQISKFMQKVIDTPMDSLERTTSMPFWSPGTASSSSRSTFTASTPTSPTTRARRRRASPPR